MMVCPNCGGILRAESHGWICEKCKGFISLQDGKFYEYIEKPFMPQQTNADRMIKMLQENDVYSLLDWWQEIFEDGVPSEDYFKWWLQQPAEVDDGQT